MDKVNIRFKTVRKTFKYTQKDFAKELGISQTHISGIENGNENPSLPVLKLICYKFNIDEDWLINGIGKDDNNISSPAFDSTTKEGLISKYNELRVMLEQMLRDRENKELEYSVRSFSYFIGILSLTELKGSNREEYLSNALAVINEFEKLKFSASTIKNLMPRKHKEEYLLKFKQNTESKIQEISEKMLNAVNTYLKQFDTYVTLNQEDKKAYDDKCMPNISKDYSKISSNQQWVADHHIFDMLVVDEKGEVFRPWLSGWIDRKSRYVVGFVVNKVSPNSDIVLDSFTKACHQCGIPDEVLLDNGKDYKVFAQSVSKPMGIRVTNAIPYNAKVKPIERLFGTLEDKYCKSLPCYIGNDSKKRPEKMQKANAELKDRCMSYKDFLEFVPNMIKDYNNSPHTGRGMDGRTPIEVYKSSFAKSEIDIEW